MKNMLPLDDPRWTSLDHAYGPAADVPNLLRKLEIHGEDKDQIWFNLWSELCHQGDVYTASYAAVPHIVGIALHAQGSLHNSFLQLPTAIEVARQTNRGPTVPDDLANEYHAAIVRLTDVVAAGLQQEWSVDALINACAALAVAKGHPNVAEAMLNLDSDMIDRIRALDFS